jgi:integrase/recombinase XerC
VHRRDLTVGPCGVQLLLHGKGRKLRVVPVGDHLAAATAGEVGWLFPGDDGHLSPPYSGKLVVAALPDHRTAHTLRQRFTSRAYRGSRNLRVVQTLLGHSSVATTERRTAVDDEAAMLAAQVCASATTRAHVFAQ